LGNETTSASSSHWHLLQPRHFCLNTAHGQFVRIASYFLKDHVLSGLAGLFSIGIGTRPFC
jgi:hypothetical protein